jgi:hypothetical protein
VASATPAAPTPTPAQATLAWSAGERLGDAAFTDAINVAYEPGRGRLSAAEVIDPSALIKRYRMRTIDVTGAQFGANELVPAGGEAPTSVDAITFDQSTNPVLAYRNKEVFQLYKVAGTTIAPMTGFPLNAAKRAGPVVMRNDVDVLSVAALILDPDGDQPTGGQIALAQAKEGELAKALIQIPDPFYPTTRLAFQADGSLLIAGAVREGGWGLKRLKADRSLTDVVIAGPPLPDGMWAAPNGDIYLTVAQGLAQPTKVWRFGPSGDARGETEVRLKNGGYVQRVTGIAFDMAGKPYVSGSGYNGANRVTSGIFTFAE